VIIMSLSVLPMSKAAAQRGGPQTDQATAEWEGQSFIARSWHGVTMALARQLVGAGCPDQPWEAHNAEGQRLLFGSSLHRLAQMTIGGDRFGRYQERPDFLSGVSQDGEEPAGQG